MRDETRAFLNSILKITWFTNVGKPLQSTIVGQINSLEEVVERIAEEVEWENLAYHVNRTEFTRCLEKELGYERSGEMRNDAVLEIKAVFLEPLERTLQKTELFRHPAIAKLKEKQKGRFLGGFTWNVLFAALEIEFSDYVTSHFYRDIIDWYRKGRIPCGWEGRYPEGRLLVY